MYSHGLLFLCLLASSQAQSGEMVAKDTRNAQNVVESQDALMNRRLPVLRVPRAFLDKTTNAKQNGKAGSSTRMQVPMKIATPQPEPQTSARPIALCGIILSMGAIVYLCRCRRETPIEEEESSLVKPFLADSEAPLPGAVMVGDIVRSDIDFTRRNGEVLSKGDCGKVQGVGKGSTSDKSHRVNVDFENMKNVNLTPSQFTKVLEATASGQTDENHDDYMANDEFAPSIPAHECIETEPLKREDQIDSEGMWTKSQQDEDRAKPEFIQHCSPEICGEADTTKLVIDTKPTSNDGHIEDIAEGDTSTADPNSLGMPLQDETQIMETNVPPQDENETMGANASKEDAFFNSIDRNNDGVISHAEWNQVLEVSEQEPPQTAEPTSFIKASISTESPSMEVPDKDYNEVDRSVQPCGGSFKLPPIRFRSLSTKSGGSFNVPSINVQSKLGAPIASHSPRPSGQASPRAALTSPRILSSYTMPPRVITSFVSAQSIPHSRQQTIDVPASTRQYSNDVTSRPTTTARRQHTF